MVSDIPTSQARAERTTRPRACAGFVFLVGFCSHQANEEHEEDVGLCGEFEHLPAPRQAGLGTFGRLQMRHRESEIERLTRALERTAAPPCRYYGLGDSEVAGFGGRLGGAAVAQLGR
jgi:hypothetical protein